MEKVKQIIKTNEKDEQIKAKVENKNNLVYNRKIFKNIND